MRSFLGPVVITASLAVGGVVVAGCSSETAAEKIAESATGADVDIEENGDVRISTPEGEMDISSDQELPADFPSDVPVPDGRIESMTTSNATGSGPSYIFTVRVDGEVPAVTEQVSADFVAAGWPEVSKTTAADGASLSYLRDDGRSVTLAVGEDSEGVVLLQYIVVATAAP